jgi:virulence factor Mce-like protein
MSANRPTSGAALARLRLAGVAFLVVIVLLVAMTILIYQKAFTPTVDVTLMADRAGNQLTSPADVKVRGVIVGETRGITATDDGSRIELALDPDKANDIPTNVSARLLPKTLFGEKFVELVLPPTPAGRSLESGDVIAQDRSETAREFATALDNFLPLLQTLKPEQVSTTLNALSTTLRGRGDKVGSNFVLVRDYLREINPEIPELGRNFAGLADFADNLDAAAPDFLQVLANLSEINRNLVDQQDEMDVFLRRTAEASGVIEGFVDENEQRFIGLAREGRLPLELFAAYAPIFPCLAQGLAESELFIGDTFGGLQPGLHITLEFIEDQGSYTPEADEPEYLDSRGPDCFGLPRPDVPAGDFNFQDGFRDELPRETTGSPGDSEPSGSSSASSPFGPASFSSPAAQRSIINAAVAPVLGTSVDRVPDLAHLLFGPVARGTAVGLSSRSAS